MEIEISTSGESSSENESELATMLRPQTLGGNEDFSIDGLLAARDHDATVPSAAVPVNDDDSPVSEFHAPIEFNAFESRDASVFDFSQGNLPFRVFGVIDREGPPEPICFPRMKEWQWKALKTDMAHVEVSSTLLFSMIQELVFVRSFDIGRMIIKFAEIMPKHSISYSIWFRCVKEAMFSAIDVVGFILGLSFFENFSFDEEEDDDVAKMEIIMLHFSVLLCPPATESPAAVYAYRALRSNLMTSGFNDAQAKNLADECYALTLDVPVRNLSLLASMLPLDGIGAQIMFVTAIKLCYDLMKLDVPSNVTFDGLVKVIGHLKQLCQSSDDDDLFAASAIMALSERAFLAGIKLKIVTKEAAQIFAETLKFSFSNSDAAVLTELKEQVHVTRTQVDMLIHAVMGSQQDPGIEID